MKNCTDAELIDLIRHSDHSAFDELHCRFWHPLFRIAYKKTGDADESNDILQDMFIELWEKRKNLDFNNTVDNWLRNRLWFKLAGYFRTKVFSEKHLESFRLFMEQQAETVIPGNYYTIDEAENYYEEILNIIHIGIADMPDKMREIFQLSRSGNYTVKEIAEKLNISPFTVKAQLERATAKLKKIAVTHQPNALEYLLALWLINY